MNSCVCFSWRERVSSSFRRLIWSLFRPRLLRKCFGDYMMVTRDYRNGEWWLNDRLQGHGIRNATLRTSKDLLHWSEPKVFFENDAENHFGGLFEWHGGMTPFNYGNLNLGFLERWSNAGFGNTCELICHRDGQSWQRVARGARQLEPASQERVNRYSGSDAHGVLHRDHQHEAMEWPQRPQHE